MEENLKGRCFVKTVAIIGAGASGLACAKVLLENAQNTQVMLFDKNQSIAKKIAATGNGKCNLSNVNIIKEAYQGEIEGLMETIQQFDILSFCHDLGFLTRQNGNLYYPYSEQAKTVVHSFEKMLEKSNAELYLNTTIIEIVPKEEGYLLVDEHKHRYFVDIVVVSAGGKAGQGFGTDGQIFEVLKPLGFKMVPLRPSLVAMICKENVKKIKGCRFHGTFTLEANQKMIASYDGEGLITDNGISGIACMQLSRFLEFDTCQNYRLHCNLIPNLKKEDVMAYYQQNGACYEGIVNDKLASYLTYKPTTSFEQFYERLSDLVFTIQATRDFSFAQVTKGGISLNNLDEHLMSKKYKNMYFCGEVLNVDGDCGGYNLHFAFASGQMVGRQIIS